MVVPAVPPAHIPPPAMMMDLSVLAMTPVYTTGIIVIGILIALGIALRKTDSKDRADVIRAVAEAFRWFRRGGPPRAG